MLAESLPVVLLKVPLPLELLRSEGVPPPQWFTPQMLVNALKYQGKTLSLLIDLSEKVYYPEPEMKQNASGTANPSSSTTTSSDVNTPAQGSQVFEKLGVGYIHVPWPTREPPALTQQGNALVSRVVKLLSGAIDSLSLDNKENNAVVGICCEDGYTKSGFAAVSYLCEVCENDLKAAVNIVKESRPPGILKQSFLDNLYKRYGKPTLGTAFAPNEGATNESKAASSTLPDEFDKSDLDAIPIAPGMRELPDWAKPNFNPVQTTTQSSTTSTSAGAGESTTQQTLSQQQQQQAAQAQAPAAVATAAATGVSATGRKLPSHVRKALAAQAGAGAATATAAPSTSTVPGLGEKKDRPESSAANSSAQRVRLM